MRVTAQHGPLPSSTALIVAWPLEQLGMVGEAYVAPAIRKPGSTNDLAIINSLLDKPQPSK